MQMMTLDMLQMEVGVGKARCKVCGCSCESGDICNRSACNDNNQEYWNGVLDELKAEKNETGAMYNKLLELFPVSTRWGVVITDVFRHEFDRLEMRRRECYSNELRRLNRQVIAVSANYMDEQRFMGDDNE